MNKKDEDNKEEKLKEINNYCEECRKEDKSVSQNLILIGFKICNSCKISKTIFPIQLLTTPAGRLFNLLIIKEIDKNNVENSMVLKVFNRLLLIKNTLINFAANVHTFNEMANNI